MVISAGMPAQQPLAVFLPIFDGGANQVLTAGLYQGIDEDDRAFKGFRASPGEGDFDGHRSAADFSRGELRGV